MPEVSLGEAEEVELDLTDLYEKVEEIALQENSEVNGELEE